MLKPITSGLIIFLITFASQGDYAAPAPNPKFKIPGLGTYRSGVGFVGDATELPWKQAADAAKAGTDRGADAAKKGYVTAGSVTAGLVGGGVGTVGGLADAGIITRAD